MNDLSLPANKADALPKALLAATLNLWRQAGDAHWLTIAGQSMLPLIQPGDRVLAVHDLSDLCLGEIVLFWQHEQLIAHRLIHKMGDAACATFIAKGDNVVTFDPPINAQALVGRVVAVQRLEQITRLDNRRWRLLGWLIAKSTLLVTSPYPWRLWRQERYTRCAAALAMPAQPKARQGIVQVWCKTAQRGINLLLRAAAN